MEWGFPKDTVCWGVPAVAPPVVRHGKGSAEYWYSIIRRNNYLLRIYTRIYWVRFPHTYSIRRGVLAVAQPVMRHGEGSTEYWHSIIIRHHYVLRIYTRINGVRFLRTWLYGGVLAVAAPVMRHGEGSTEYWRSIIRTNNYLPHLYTRINGLRFPRTWHMRRNDYLPCLHTHIMRCTSHRLIERGCNYESESYCTVLIRYQAPWETHCVICRRKAGENWIQSVMRLLISAHKEPARQAE